MRFMKYALLLSIGIVAALLPLTAFAQGALTGTISGPVVDPSGLPLPGVSVTISSPRLQGVRTAVTTSHGDYIFPFLPAGEYAITFELPGFKPLKTTLGVKLSESTSFTAKLALATQTEEVTVVADAPGEPH